MAASEDLLRVINRLVPKRDGEPYTVHRTALVDAVNSDGTVDLEVSGVVIPDVPVLGGATAPVGAVVSVLAWQGALLVLGAPSVTEQRGPVRQVFTSNGTWTKPAGAVACFVQVQGAGGGGAGAYTTTTANTSSCGGGGGGGGYREVWIDASSLSSTETVTVGSGGAAGSGSGNGSPGGESSFGAHAVGAGGGGGNVLAAGTSSVNITGGGHGGSTSGTATGSISLAGGHGGKGVRLAGTPSFIVNETLRGGDSFMGQGGAPPLTNVGTDGNSGGDRGGGGGGGVNFQGQSVIRSGGAGANGIVIVTTYF